MSIGALITPFRIKGEEVTSEMINAAIPVMRQKDFLFTQLCGALYRAGVSWDNHDRAGDRLLQRARKLGLVRHEKGLWKTVPEAWQ